MPLAEVTALNYTTPVLVTILAVVLLDEQMTRAKIRALATYVSNLQD